MVRLPLGQVNYPLNILVHGAPSKLSLYREQYTCLNVRKHHSEYATGICNVHFRSGQSAPPSARLRRYRGFFPASALPCAVQLYPGQISLGIDINSSEEENPGGDVGSLVYRSGRPSPIDSRSSTAIRRLVMVANRSWSIRFLPTVSSSPGIVQPES